MMSSNSSKATEEILGVTIKKRCLVSSVNFQRGVKKAGFFPRVEQTRLSQVYSNSEYEMGMYTGVTVECLSYGEREARINYVDGLVAMKTDDKFV
jgi:hypothetical protein